jgi:putative oxidoreductase
MSGFGPTVLRLVVGAVFLAHGVMKVSPAFDGLPETTAMLALLDFKVPHLVAAALGAVELGGGIALMLGAHTGWTAIALLLTTGVTSWKLHLPNGLFLNWSLEPGAGHGVEFDLVLVGALLCLVATGAGRLSFDRARRRMAELEAAGRARLRRDRRDSIT